MNMLIEKYTPQWINDYASIKCEIEKGLHSLNLTMEHIGSTSVPELDLTVKNKLNDNKVYDVMI